MKLVDLPDSTTLAICSFVIDPCNLEDARNVCILNRFFRKLLQTLLQQLISLQNRAILLLEKLPTLRTYFSFFTPKFIIVGGHLNNRKCDIFLPYEGVFKRCSGIGLKRTEGFDVTFYRGFALAISGADDSAVAKVEAYSIEHNSWHQWPSLPSRLSALTCVNTPHGLFIVGGLDQSNSRRSNSILKLVHQEPFPAAARSYDHVQIQWLSTASTMTKGRSHHGAAYYDHCIWIAGGLITGHMVATNMVEVVDLHSGQCWMGPSMLRHRLQPKLLVIDGNLYAVGGDVDGTSHSVCSIERYDLMKNAWIFVVFFPQPRRRVRCAIAAYDSRIFVFGGSDGPNILTTWDYYDVRSHYWASQLQSLLREGSGQEQQQFNVQISSQEMQFVHGLNLQVPGGQPACYKSSVAAYIAQQ